MLRDSSPFFQVASYNWLIDNRRLFPNSTFNILLLIFRQTIGFQKEQDFIRYSQICKKTGLCKGAVSTAINFLLKNQLIERYDNRLEPIQVMKRGYRGEIYYEISESLYQKLNQYYVKNWNSAVLKNDTYKDKYKQKEFITKKNVEVASFETYEKLFSSKKGKYDDVVER